MSGWHREHPELIGTDADPWMIHEDYRGAVKTGYVSDGRIAQAEEERDSAMCVCGHRWDQHDSDPPGGGYCEAQFCDCAHHEEA